MTSLNARHPVPTVPRSILVPIPLGDDDARWALEAAGALAAALGAEVILAGIAPVVHPEGVDFYVSLPLEPARLRQQRDLVEELTSDALQESERSLPHEVASRTVLCWGEVGVAIIEAASREGADLIVIPMRYRHAIGHLLHDGTDRYVFHNSDVPVLVVPVGQQQRAAGR